MTTTEHTGTQSNVRQIVYGLFDTPVGDLRVDPIMTTGVRNDLYFWTQKSHTPEGKKGPNDVSRTYGLYCGGYLCDLGRGQPFVCLRVDESPAHVRDAVSSGTDAYTVDSKRSHIHLRHPHEGIVA